MSVHENRSYAKSIKNQEAPKDSDLKFICRFAIDSVG